MTEQSYERVLPRDLFNEAQLLKGLARLSLCIEEGRLDKFGVEQMLEDPKAGFQVERDYIHDGLFSANYVVSIAGQELYFYSHYNSENFYPLYCLKQTDDAQLVFDNLGSFTPEFLAFLGTFIQVVNHPEIPRRVVMSNIPMSLGNNFTREHLVNDLAQNTAFMTAFERVCEMDGVEEVEVISTERLLLSNLSRVVQEEFALDELYAELKAINSIPAVFTPNPDVS